MALTKIRQEQGVVINEGSTDVDFRVESNAGTHALFVDGANSAVSFKGDGTNQIINSPVPSKGAWTQYYKDMTPSFVGGIGTYSPQADASVSGLVFSTYAGSWLERMRIASSGNVGIGTASPDGRLDVTGSGNTEIYINTGNNSGDNSRIFFGDTADIDVGWLNYDHGTNSMSFGVNAAERMRIASSGNVGIGLTNPSDYYAKDLVVAAADEGGITLECGTAEKAYLMFADGTSGAAAYAGYIGYDHNIGALNIVSSGYMNFYTGPSQTEYMRIDANGNLMVGQTSISQTAVGFSATQGGIVSTAMASALSSSNTYHVYSTGASAYRFYVGMHGTVFATTTTISAISDVRYKENIRDLDDGLSKIMALQPRKFDWKEGKGRDVKDDRGWIAQEIETVFPDLVDEWLDESPEGEEPYKSVRPDLIPVLVKAMQELSAKNDALEARITALE